MASKKDHGVLFCIFTTLICVIELLHCKMFISLSNTGEQRLYKHGAEERGGGQDVCRRLQKLLGTTTKFKELQTDSKKTTNTYVCFHLSLNDQ